jgi:hypothetical protein
MKRFPWIQSSNARFALAFGAAIGIGNAITRGLIENLGFLPGVLFGAAATALLALGFSVVLSAKLTPKTPAEK